MVRTMLQGLVSRARQLAQDLQRSLLRPVPPPTPARPAARPVPAAYGPLGRVLLTDGVGRTLFEEFAGHRAAARGEEETGWVLVGLREASEAVVLATFPAGTRRDAGVAHIRFDSSGQVVASRIIRQADRRLTILGVVHTHPGSLRHPSDGDLRGDGQWVRHLRGREGVFGIGTADAPGADAMFAYRPLPAELTIGPDLARPLHAIWEMLESHAERIDRLYRQQAGVRFAVTEDEWGPGLILTVPLAAGGDAIRVVVRPKGVFYYVLQGGEVLEVQHHDEQVDRGVYLLLAELASRA
jgi:proteasome lid subunit RPN8/RPN11